MLPPFIGATSGVSNSNLGSKLLISKLFSKNTLISFLTKIFKFLVSSVAPNTLTFVTTELAFFIFLYE